MITPRAGLGAGLAPGGRSGGSDAELGPRTSDGCAAGDRDAFSTCSTSAFSGTNPGIAIRSSMRVRGTAVTF